MSRRIFLLSKKLFKKSRLVSKDAILPTISPLLSVTFEKATSTGNVVPSVRRAMNSSLSPCIDTLYESEVRASAKISAEFDGTWKFIYLFDKTKPIRNRSDIQLIAELIDGSLQRLMTFLNPMAVSPAIAVLDLSAIRGVCVYWWDGFDGLDRGVIE